MRKHLCLEPCEWEGQQSAGDGEGGGGGHGVVGDGGGEGGAGASWWWHMGGGGWPQAGGGGVGGRKLVGAVRVVRVWAVGARAGAVTHWQPFLNTYAWNRVSGKGSRVVGTVRVVGARCGSWGW